MLTVRPSQRDHGIGTMLTQWGLDRAKVDKLPVLVQVNDDAGRFYKRSGFKPVSTFEMDLEDFDSGKEEMQNLVWSAEAVSEL